MIKCVDECVRIIWGMTFIVKVLVVVATPAETALQMALSTVPIPVRVGHQGLIEEDVSQKKRSRHATFQNGLCVGLAHISITTV